MSVSFVNGDRGLRVSKRDIADCIHDLQFTVGSKKGLPDCLKQNELKFLLVLLIIFNRYYESPIMLKICSLIYCSMSLFSNCVACFYLCACLVHLNLVALIAS
jgi:hypothetical protein